MIFKSTARNLYVIKLEDVYHISKESYHIYVRLPESILITLDYDSYLLASNEYTRLITEWETCLKRLRR